MVDLEVTVNKSGLCYLQYGLLWDVYNKTLPADIIKINIGGEFTMERKEVEISVYGAEQLCASCVNLPSARDTYEWLEAAISRKFPGQSFKITYVDIFDPPGEQAKKNFAERVIKEDMVYPVVLIEDKIVAEGNPRLKVIFSEMEKYGYRAE